MFFQKLFTPWKAFDAFAEESAWYGYMLRYNKVMNVLRVIFWVVAFAFLMLFTFTDDRLYCYIFVGVMLPSIPITLAIGQNEKQLPEGMRKS